MVFLKHINFTKGISYFSALVGLWGASGALGPSWKPFLDLSGRISGLGSSLGPSLGASVSFLVCF